MITQNSLEKLGVPEPFEMLGLPIVPEEDTVGLTNLEVGGLIPLGLVESGALIFSYCFLQHIKT